MSPPHTRSQGQGDGVGAGPAPAESPGGARGPPHGTQGGDARRARAATPGDGAHRAAQPAGARELLSYILGVVSIFLNMYYIFFFFGGVFG